ncbi:hypothetical protein [Flagellimonas sp.]|uniref:hypothetical protein n=1 Tax=Flagellimonas sp. TaxID=2058762 RepID=UPI003BABCA40
MNNNKIKKVIHHLNPYWDEIIEDFKVHAEKLNALLAQNHNEIGLVLKIHLIVEHYLTSSLSRTFQLDEIDKVRLSFSQKVKLIPKSDIAGIWLKPGIIELNKLRNEYAHNLNAELKFDDLVEIKKIVSISRDISHNSFETLLNDFAIICGSFLGKSNPKITKLFKEAFKN